MIAESVVVWPGHVQIRGGFVQTMSKLSRSEVPPVLRPQVPVENMAEIAWGALLLIYLVGSGRPEYLQPSVLLVFGLSGGAALLELYLRRIRWRWLLYYDLLVWTLLLSAMVALTGGRGSELWIAYILMSLTAPSVEHPSLPYLLLGVNVLIYAGIYLWVNPYGAPFNLSVLLLRMGMVFLVLYVIDRSMDRERASQQSALAAARNRVRELVSTRDAERKRIAGDIHDWLGTGIVAPMRRLELAQRSPGLEEVRVQIGAAVESLRQSHEELRRIMEDLHPHLLEQMGLGDALGAYVRQWGIEQGREAEFTCDLRAAPGPEVSLALYRILQEALNNAANHAAGAPVQVRLHADRQGATLIAADRGPGGAAPRGSGRGLTGMAERAAVFGGGVKILSRPGQGTTVTAYLPAGSDG